jgi:chloramphenicol 3-O phosphotransferase
VSLRGVPQIGQIVILNGPSRSGKTSIAGALQADLSVPWMNIGMDGHIAATPPAYRPGVGLRPQRVDMPIQAPGRVTLAVLEDLVPTLYAALYESVAAHARLGLNVVCDVYHHDFYSRPRGILADCSRRLIGLPVLFVGVLCPDDEIWRRREATWGQVRDNADDDLLLAVELGQRAAREHGYDLALDTSVQSPEECAEAVRRRLTNGPPGRVFDELASSVKS